MELLEMLPSLNKRKRNLLYNILIYYKEIIEVFHVLYFDYLFVLELFFL